MFIIDSIKSFFNPFFIYRIDPNPFDKTKDKENYKLYERFNNDDQLFYKDSVASYIKSKYYQWIIKTSNNKVSTAKKLLTIIHNLENDRKEVIEFLVRNYLHKILKVNHHIPRYLKDLNNYSSYSITFYYINDSTLPLYDRFNYAYDGGNKITKYIIVSNIGLCSLYFPKLHSNTLVVIDFIGKTLFKTIRMRLFNYNLFNGSDDQIKEYIEEKKKIGIDKDIATFCDISYMNLKDPNCDLDKVSQEFRYYFDMNVKKLYTLTKDKLYFYNGIGEMIE